MLETAQTATRHPIRPRALVMVGLGLIVCFLLVFSRSMQRGIDHDEHQFVAGAALLAHQGLLPYADHPWFHTPYLLAVDAALFSLTDSPFQAARALNAVLATLLVGVLGLVALRRFDVPSSFLRVAAAGGAMGLLMFEPFFAYTSGVAWNHDPAALCAILATLFLLRGLGREGSSRQLFVAGLLLSLAVGFRITLAPLMAPFGLALLLRGWHQRELTRGAAVAPFSLGAALGLAPLAAFALPDVGAFLFGVFGYSRLNTAYREDTGWEAGMTLDGKLSMLMEHMRSHPGTLLLVVLFAVAVYQATRAQPCARRGVSFVILCLPFLALGSLAPTPSWPQYFYMPVPFLVLAVVHGLSSAQTGRLAGPFVLLVSAVFAAAVGLAPYRTLSNLGAPEVWLPSRLHAVGAELREHLDHGPVVSLSPIPVLEAGLTLHPAFSTGPFAWRTGGVLSDEERDRYGFCTQDNLAAVLAAAPPRALLTGVQTTKEYLRIEAPLLAWARAHGYRTVGLAGGAQLHLAP